MGNKSKMGNYEIYDHNNELIYKFTSKFKDKMIELGLPIYSFIRSYQKNVRINRGVYKNWYAIKLSNVNSITENSGSH